MTNRETDKEVYNYKYGKYDPDKENEILKKVRALIKPILDENENHLSIFSGCTT